MLIPNSSNNISLALVLVSDHGLRALEYAFLGFNLQPEAAFVLAHVLQNKRAVCF